MSDQTVPIVIDRVRLLDTAVRLIAVHSPTGHAGIALDTLAELLAADGFLVERIEAGHPAAPAVAVRFDSGRPGPTIQFNGHIDTVHLPFVPPEIVGNRLTGSGSCDMKGGLAAAIEALRAVRDADALPTGSILLTAHDLHEAPWGDGHQLDAMIASGLVGDAVLLPEPLSAHLPTIGRGQACWKATVSRPGPAVHEVMRPAGEPNVIAVAAELITRLMRLDATFEAEPPSPAGRSSVFVGQIHGGEIYNGYPHECTLDGTRRWLPGTDRRAVERDFRAIVAGLAAESGASIDLAYQLVRDAFRLDESSRLVSAFQAAFVGISGEALKPGPKPFVDDGNSFWSLAGIAAITHGPKAGGQHTVNEWADIDDLVRVAQLYAVTSTLFCQRG
jgi:acetylornithine deacetylase/succinyl-diaminopimelate desuccinylase-like protein